MKFKLTKLALVVTLLMLAFCTNAQQTVYYEYQYSVTADGVKSQDYALLYKQRYLTFSNRYNICYWSNKNGEINSLFGFGPGVNLDNSRRTYQYKQSQDNKNLYLYYSMGNRWNNFQLQPTEGIIVSQDLTYMEVFDCYGGVKGQTAIFKKSTPPEERSPESFF